MQLSDKTILITGAARGIGQQTALTFAQEGAHIMGVDLQLDDLQETADAVERLGLRFDGFACDVSDLAAGRALIDEAAQTHGGFDVLINNAGVLPSGPFLERDFDVWKRVLDVNLTGLAGLCHAALPHLIERESGHIVNISSVAGKIGSPGLAAYSASKHGVVGFSASLRTELAMQGINVGVSWICPTIVDTRLSDGIEASGLITRVEIADVARAIMRAVQHNEGEVFLPRRMRWIVGVLPNVSPGVVEWLTLRDKTAHSWMTARKPLTGDSETTP